MSDLSAIDFLESPSSTLGNVYGHLVSLYELKIGRTQNYIIPFVFVNFDEKMVLRFSINYKTKEIIDLLFTDLSGNHISPLIATYTGEGAETISSVCSVYLSRLEQMIKDHSKDLNSFIKNGPAERKPTFECTEGYEYCHYFIKLSMFIENVNRLDVFNYTLETLDEPGSAPFGSIKDLALA